MKEYELYIFDLDGTLYRGSQPIPHVSDVLSKLRRDGAIIRCLTNHSGLPARAQAQKLTGMGIPVEDHEIVTSTMVAARQVQKLGIDSVFAVGEPGMGMALEEAGVRCANLVGEVLEPESNQRAGAVLAGICSGIDYRWITCAMRLIYSGALFLAANRDATYPIEHGVVLPGSGATVGAIVGCTGREPVVMGKPEPAGILHILEETQVAPSDTLVIGDRYETDILAAKSAGCDSTLVLTGVTREPIEEVPCIADLRALVHQDLDSRGQPLK